MNMILHDCPTAEIWRDNTLANPHFREHDGRLKTYDFVVANPPFSTKAWSSGLDPAHDPYQRFTHGIPPQKNGDYAFLLHVLACLKSAGKGAIILPHGVLFRGGAEAAIRREIVRRGYIKGIIGLPANLFYGTGIPACIVVLDKSAATTRPGIFMVDAAKGFLKDGNKNRLRAQDIHRIVDTFTRDQDVPRYARIVPLAEIEANDFNLNLPRYIDSTEPEDLQDIDAHLRGGIPERDLDALAAYWDVLPAVRAALFTSAGRPGYRALTLPVAAIKAAIFGHPEFTAFNATVTARFDQWQAQSRPALHAPGDHPKDLITALAESMLATFADAPLLDPYDIYQRLMDFWEGQMQDDLYLIVQEGWCAATELRLIVEVKGQKSKEQPDFTVGKQKYKADLIPPALLIAHCFAPDKARIETVEAERAGVEQQLIELRDEHGSEDGLLAAVVDDTGKITKKAISDRLKQLAQPALTGESAPEDEKDIADERGMLKQYVAVMDQEASCAKQLKEMTSALIGKVIARYATLTDDEVKTLVIEDKWLAALAHAVQSEIERISQALTGRIRQLAERYATPLPQLTDEAACLAARVDVHLKQMGAVWN